VKEEEKVVYKKKTETIKEQNGLDLEEVLSN
jgi:hypothetical protein